MGLKIKTLGAFSKRTKVLAWLTSTEQNITFIIYCRETQGMIHMTQAEYVY